MIIKASVARKNTLLAKSLKNNIYKGIEENSALGQNSYTLDFDQVNKETLDAVIAELIDYGYNVRKVFSDDYNLVYKISW